jgi:hypothetical protein
MASAGQAGMQTRQLVHLADRIKALSSLISMAASGQTATHSWHPVQASWSTTGFGEGAAARPGPGVSTAGTLNCRVMGEPQPGQAVLKQGTPGRWGRTAPHRGQIQFSGAAAGPIPILPRPAARPGPPRPCRPLAPPPLLPAPNGIATSHVRPWRPPDPLCGRPGGRPHGRTWPSECNKCSYRSHTSLQNCPGPWR